MISPVSFRLLQYMLHTCECTHNSVRILWGKKENAALQFELIRCSVQLDHVQCFFRNHKMRKLILVRSSVSWSSVNCTSGFNRIITTNIRKQIDQVRAEINKRFCITIMQGFALPLSLFYAWLHKDFMDYDISTSGFLPKKSTFLLLMRYFFSS